MTVSSPLSWLVRARRAGGGTLDRQCAPAVVGSHTLGRGKSYLTAEMPRPMPGREVGCRRGQRTLVVACWRTPGREVGYRTGQRALVVACWRTLGREVGR